MPNAAHPRDVLLRWRSAEDATTPQEMLCARLSPEHLRLIAHVGIKQDQTSMTASLRSLLDEYARLIGFSRKAWEEDIKTTDFTSEDPSPQHNKTDPESATLPGFVQPGGIFRLKQSDSWCGSWLTVTDAAELFHASEAELRELVLAHRRPKRKPLPMKTDQQVFVHERDLLNLWYSREISSRQVRFGNNKRTLDELIIEWLARAYVGDRGLVLLQVPWGENRLGRQSALAYRQRADLLILQPNRALVIECLAPSRFIFEKHAPRDPLELQGAMETHFTNVESLRRSINALLDPEDNTIQDSVLGTTPQEKSQLRSQALDLLGRNPEVECALWPYWIQRCTLNADYRGPRNLQHSHPTMRSHPPIAP